MENHPDVSADFNGVSHTITSFDEFEAAIAALIESPQEWEAKVDQFLEANQWSNRADEAMDIIINHPRRVMTPRLHRHPMYNAEAWLRESLPHFWSNPMKVLGRHRLGSTDGTLPLLEPHERIRVHAIPSTDFGHGKTRNLATSLSNSELLLFTVQDACPRDPHWLSGMVNDLLAFNLNAVCGGQAVPHDRDKNPVQWYRPVNETNKVEIVRGDEFIQWSPEQQMRACGWDNVNALYTREALLKTPFEDVRFGEDMTWAKAHLSSGGSIGYAKAHKVWHYHHRIGDLPQAVLNQLYWRHKHLAPCPLWLDHLPSCNRSEIESDYLAYGHMATGDVFRWLAYNRRLQKESHLAGREFLLQP